MKRTLHILSITAIVAFMAVAMTACSSKQKTDTATNLVLSASDTAGLADFQEWKAQNERKDAMEYMASKTATTTSAARPAVVRKPVASTPAPAPVAAKKKGWSKAAKGTTIGAVAGAAAGAIINKKNRVLGGVIGGVIGGGVGYGIGRGMDKKDGRVK
jgi:Glycine zipper